MEPGADLMLLHPDGSEEVLVPVKPQESIADPFVSFDGQSVYYAKMHDAKNHKGADIYKVHVATKKIVQLTQQTLHAQHRRRRLVENPAAQLGRVQSRPVPAAGWQGRSSSATATASRAPTPATRPTPALQLFVMDDDGSNVECIGHLNIGMALHPVILKDGRVMFSSLESQGLRSHHLWGVWSIHPDGTTGARCSVRSRSATARPTPRISRPSSPTSSIVVESYYNLNNFGFGTYYKFPAAAAGGLPRVRPGYKADPPTPRCAMGVTPTAGRSYIRFPFSPYGIEALTPFVHERRLAVGAVGARQERFAAQWASSPIPPGPGQSPADRLVARLRQQLHRHTSRPSTAAST